MAASMDKTRFSRMYGYESNELFSLSRINEFRRIHITITQANMEINTQDPPNEATLSASFWPNVICSE